MGESLELLRPDESESDMTYHHQMSFYFKSLLTPPGVNMPCIHQHEAEPVHNKTLKLYSGDTGTYPL